MNESIEQVAFNIKQYYCLWKRKVWKKYSPDDADKVSLLKAAELCCQCGFNARAFVHAQTVYSEPERFKGCFLHSRDAVKKYRDYMEKVSETELPSVYSHYNQRLVRAGSTIKDFVRILGSEFHDYPAWYRIVVTVEPEPHIIALYQSKAQEEMDLNPNIRDFILSESTLRGALCRIET